MRQQVPFQSEFYYYLTRAFNNVSIYRQYANCFEVDGSLLARNCGRDAYFLMEHTILLKWMDSLQSLLTIRLLRRARASERGEDTSQKVVGEVSPYYASKLFGSPGPNKPTPVKLDS